MAGREVLLRFGLGLVGVSVIAAAGWRLLESLEPSVHVFSAVTASLATLIASQLVLKGRPGPLKGFAYLSILPARASAFVRGFGSILFATSVLFGASSLSAVPLDGAALQWSLGAAVFLSVLEAGALKVTRCPDTGRKGLIWQFRTCAGSLPSCSGREVHAASLYSLNCLFCQEELRVRATRAQSREVAHGKKCERRYARGTPTNPVEFCYCKNHVFARSEFLDDYCPQEGCEFSQERADQRAAIRMPSSIESA